MATSSKQNRRLADRRLAEQNKTNRRLADRRLAEQFLTDIGATNNGDSAEVNLGARLENTVC
jgi:hypothetical protein